MKQLHQIPKFFWHAIVEYGFFWWYAPVMAVQGLVIAFYPPEMLTSRQQRVIIGSTVFLVIVFGTYAVLHRTTNSDPSNKITMVRVLAGLAVVVGQYLGMWHQLRRTLARENATEYTPRQKSLLWWSLKFGLVFFAGFYGALIFADRLFPTAVLIMREKTEGKGTGGLVMQSTVLFGI